MPKQKDLKRLVRSRMQKTGESYTGARAQLLAKRARPKAAEPEPNYAALAGMSDESVRAKTGRTWKQWVQTLDAIDGASLRHRDLAQRVYEDFGVPDWWSQTVTVGYERIRGLREIGQRRGGAYEVSKSKTFPVNVGALYRAFSYRRLRKRWLGVAEFEMRTATADKSMRVTWSDGTSVEIYFVGKGASKSQVTIQHRKLPSKAESDKVKQFWSERLGFLATVLVPEKTARG